MSRGWLGLFVCLVLGAFGASGAAGQSVRGTLVDVADGGVLPGAMVQLLDEAGAVVDSSRSDASGAFVLRAGRPGRYVLYFVHAGYATVPSDVLQLGAGAVDYRFEVPLLGGAALRRISEVIDIEARLQGNLTELCGERPRPETSGILIGVVRDRADRAPVSGAIVEVTAHDGEVRFGRITTSSANGVYVVCNIPAGEAHASVRAPRYLLDAGPVTVRAGSVAWYDFPLSRR